MQESTEMHASCPDMCEQDALCRMVFTLLKMLHEMQYMNKACGAF